MIYNQNTDGQDIVTLVTDYTGQNATAHINQITRAVNVANTRIWSLIFDAYGGWVYDDGNNTTLPSAVADLVEDQGKYTLPTDSLTVQQVEIELSNGESWQRLKPISLEEINKYRAENEFFDTSGTPIYYRLTSNVIELYPAPNYSETSGLRVFFHRGSTDFTPTSTSMTPGFASEFHPYLALGAAVEIGAMKTLKNYQLINDRWEKAKIDIQSYYRKRFEELNPKPRGVYRTDMTKYLI